MQQVQRRKTTPTAAQDPATEERSRVVRITGISDKTTKDALLNFFENKRRSGGGEIEDIQYNPEEGLADITFRSAEDAERVSQKENLLFDGAQLKLTLKELPKVLPKDDYKLHVTGISDTTTKDGLWLFMEVVSGEEVRHMLFGSNCNAIVTFEETPDLEKIKQKCSIRALNGSYVIIEQVNICDCIEVSGLGPKTTRDTIMYYFENPRQSGGGDVKNVEYVDEETTALVFFEEPSVVDNVVRRKHIINGATVKVAPHYPFLGEISENPGSGKKEKQLKVDLETKVTQATDLSKPHFHLLSFMGFTENINKQFKDLEAWLMEKELKIYFRGPDQVVKEANVAVLHTLVKLKEHEMKLPQSVAIILASDAGNSFLLKEFKSKHINAVVTLEGSDDRKILVTAIDRKDVNKAMELIEKVTAEESVHLEQDQKSLTLSEKWKKLMSTFQKSMLLKVTTELTSSTVLIAGIKEEVDKAKREIETFFEENLIITKILETDARRKKFLLRYESVVIKNIEESLKDKSVKITLDDNEEGISIQGTREGNDNAFKEVQKLIDQVKERSIDRDKPGMKKLFSDNKGMKLLSIVENDHNCIIEQFNQDGRVWYTVFASSDKQLDKADHAIKELISENSKMKYIDNPTIRELSQAQEDRIARLEAKHSTEIVVQKRFDRIVISGVSDDVAEAVIDVYEIILKDQAKMTRKFAEVVSKYVQWFYVEDGCETSYDVETNAKIEHAFMNEEDSIKFTLCNDDGKQQHYKIAFGNMTKTNVDSLEEAHVVRKVHDIVAKRGLVKQHVLKDRPLTVKMARDQEEEMSGDIGSTSILVSGMSSRTTEDALKNYFENTRRSSGGDVKEVKLIGGDGGGRATVTFDSAEIAKRVLEWGKHKLDDHPLTVTKIQQDRPRKTTPTAAQDPATEERSRVVRITGISGKTTKDALLNFFENKRRSGGGEIEDIQYIPEEGLADITFRSVEDAERVSPKENLVLHGVQLKLTLKELPKVLPKDDYKLHVTGISDTTTKDGLWSFMEVVSGEEVENILFGSNCNAMVTFEQPPDLEKIHKKCSTRALDGSHVTIEQVSICDCIEVSGLGPKTVHDTILFYFENPRQSGGGDVKKVQYIDGETTALVFFEEPSVVDKVVRRKHVINGATVKVAPHYPFLGEISENPGGGKKEKQLKVDPQTMAFIKKFFDQEFQDLLQETQVKVTWEAGSEDFVLSSMDNKIEKTKWEDSCRAIEDYIHQIITRKIEVSQVAFKKLIDWAHQICLPFKGRVDIRCRKEKKDIIILRGKKQDVEPLAEQLDDLSEEINKELEYGKAKITNTLVLTEPQFDLLSFMGFVENLKKRLKDLEAMMVKKELKIDFRGPDQVVREGNTALWQTLAKFKEHEIELPKSIVSILASNVGHLFLSSEFKRNQIDAVVSFEASDSTKVLITAADRKDTKKAMQLIEKATAEEYVHLEQDQTPLTQSEMFEKLMNSFQNSMLLKVTTELASNTVWIGGIKDEVDKAKTEIVTFFEKNSFKRRKRKKNDLKTGIYWS